MLRFWQPKRRKTVSDVEDSPTRCRVSRTNSRSAPTPSAFYFEHLCTSREVDLQPSDLRMVIMENGPRRVIFDSATIIPLNGKPTEGLRVSQCRKFELLRKRRDTSELAQLIWGAGPASQAADALKLHHLHEGKRLMLSRVFNMPRGSARDIADSLMSSDNESIYGTVRSIDSFREPPTQTAPPERFSRVRNTSLNLDSEEFEDFRAFSPPHRLSKNRRIQMSQRLSLCESQPYYPTTPRKSRSRMSSFGSQPEDDSGKQVALAIVFTNTQKAFVFQHISLIEAEVCRLEARISNAAMYTPSFLDNVHNAWEEFCGSICVLFNAPRLRNPVWLSLSESEIDDCQVATDFCTQLAALVRIYDTKTSKFFLSNLVSTVLMHHMSWVASVAAPNASPTIPVAVEPEKNLFVGLIANNEAASVPSNPHMAQFLEISGNVGHINKSTKTVVCGADSDMLSTILQVLSYFIRCSAIHNSQKGRETDCLPVSRPFSPELVSPDMNGSSPVSSTSDFSGFSPDKLRSDYDEVSTCSVEPPSSVLSSLTGLPPADSVDFLGKSLLVGPSASFSPHFIISGLIKTGRNYDKAMERMCDEVHMNEEGMQRAAASLSSSLSTCSAESQPLENVIILADAAEHTVKILSADGIGEFHSPSESIVSMFEHFVELQSSGAAPKFLITFLEDTLVEILGKSLSLVEMVSGGQEYAPPGTFSPDRVRAIVGCDHSDLRLILNVASVYYPCVLSSVV